MKFCSFGIAKRIIHTQDRFKKGGLRSYNIVRLVVGDRDLPFSSCRCRYHADGPSVTGQVRGLISSLPCEVLRSVSGTHYRYSCVESSPSQSQPQILLNIVAYVT